MSPKQTFNKSTKTNKWLATGILALVAILVSSALMMALQATRNNGQRVIAQIEIPTVSTVLKQELTKAQVELDSFKANDNARSQLEQEELQLLEKYNDAYFANLYNLIDSGADLEQISNAVFEQFGDYEYRLLEQIWDTQGQESDSLDSRSIQTRKKAYLGLGFWFEYSKVAAWIGGALVVIIPKIAAMITSVASAIGGPAGTLVGAILGFGIGALAYGLIDASIRALLDSVGWGWFNRTWREMPLFLLDAWWNPVGFSKVIDITGIMELMQVA